MTHERQAPHKPAAPTGSTRRSPRFRLRAWLVWPGLATLAACAANAPSPADAPAAAGAMAPMPAQPGMPGPPGMQMPPAEPEAAPEPMAVAADEAEEPMAKRAMARAEQKPPPPQWAPVREFPAPTYDPGYEGPRNDFRETIFWKPSIQTDSQGKAQVSFFLSDAVTSFRATAEGVGSGGAGRGDAVVGSRLPVSLAAKLPLEVTMGDRVELPVVVTNGTFRGLNAQVTAQIGPAFTLKESPKDAVHLDPQQSKTVYYDLTVVGNGSDPDAGKVVLGASASRLNDSMERTIRVVPDGFPREASAAGTLASGAVSTEEIDLSDPISGTLTASISFFPTPKATLVTAAKAMLAEPSGCFEQTSSTNYPNVMVAAYLKKAADDDPETKANVDGLLDRGYKKLAGYESQNKGYEWFGEDPGHEALTAYGLLEFVDMAQVYKGVDQEMVSRTRAWLKSRRDGKGGYKRNDRSLDSFGRASAEVTNAYITWALAEAGEKDMDTELDYVEKLSRSSTDPYLLALTAGALVAARPGTAGATEAVKRLAAKQDKDGGFPGASQSITMSGGLALNVETTSLAALALHKAGTEHGEAVRKAMSWLEDQRRGSGSFGSTQATVLALRALTRTASGGSPPEGTIEVTVNGQKFSLRADPKQTGTLTLGNLASALKVGKNTVQISAPGVKDLRLPYAVKVAYRTLKPASSAKGAVSVTVTGPQDVKVGGSVKVKVDIANTTAGKLPMVIARVGIPGGLETQKWQLDELKKKGLVDFYETREREVILYYRGMGPSAHNRLDLDLLASVPGTFTAPASQAYLYYTDEHRRFADPLKITVRR
ncbi:MAG: alpha-2-macroglobulin family protein [Polyangiaceae bacterium]